MSDLLPEPLPESPLDILKSWLDEAVQRELTPNPNAMSLATIDGPDPALRIMLCKELNARAGYVVFYTNYESDKALQLRQRARAAAVLHFDAFGRQARLVGSVLRSPAAESDAYFAVRDRASQIGAWASAQSRALASRADLLRQVEAVNARFPPDAAVPRPPHWGGYRLWLERVELWVQCDARVHDRARWIRKLTPRDAHGFDAGPWQATRLQP